MKKRIFLSYKKYLFILFLLLSVHSNSQTFTDSNLPIIVITTDMNPATALPYEIVDDPRVLGNMKIIRHPDGGRNYMTDINNAAYLNYNGRLSIELRGTASQFFVDKKGYGLTTLLPDNVSNNNVSLLGMPSENDWIFNGLAFDASLVRDYLAYNTSRQMGNYATRTAYFELVINGDYKGLYILQEKIKDDSNRVNVIEIASTDNSGDNLTGGYITKADRTTIDDPTETSAWTDIPHEGNDVNYVHHLPKPEDVTVEQDNYIHNQFVIFQSAISANDSSLSIGYPSLIDIPTFIDFMLCNEIMANKDAYAASTYFHKDRNGKLRAGPIWDFNLSLGYDLPFWGVPNQSLVDTWQFSDSNQGSKFWKDLFDNAIFKCYLSKRFHELTQPGQPMNAAYLNTFIDNTISSISEAMVRENQRWNTIPNNPLEIATIKTFISNRIAWMTDNLGSFSNCSNVVVPPLVITKINYNPATSVSFPVSSDQEFIEITNTGSATVNLSGVYFKELGLTYQFPYNSTISGNSSLYLCANAAVFQAKNGFAAFGQYSRNLSNKSQNLVLVDAFGNLIDKVQYFDSAPWPTAPDGTGSYLQLTSTSLDNNLASSWVASSASLNVNEVNNDNSRIVIYPNPTKNIVTISSSINIDSIEIIDISSKQLMTTKVNTNETSVDISNLSAGIYFVKVYSAFGIKTEKVVKE